MGLTLNDYYFALPELINFCKEVVENQAELDWKLDVYHFILNFLDDSEFISQKTSGSTGTPKTIQLPKRAMLESAKMTTEYFQLKESQVAVLCLPVKYIAGKMMVVRALFAGLNLILVEPAGTPDFSNSGKIDFCAMVPLQAANLLEQNKWPDIKTIILGGAETSPELVAKLQGVETEVYETYGMAETCSHISLKRINGEIPENIFTVLPGIRIMKDNWDCLVIDVPFLNEKIITNDCVELVSENGFRWLGRLDTIINSGGIKIQPEILEKKIGEILQKPCVVLGEPDELLGHKVVLVVETSEPEDSNHILAKLAQYLDKKMLPKNVRFMEILPRNKSFKIDRVALNQFLRNF